MKSICRKVVSVGCRHWAKLYSATGKAIWSHSGGQVVLNPTPLPWDIYHAVPAPRAKQILRIIDHGSIFLLIAGTYTPFTLGVLRGGWGWTLFGLIWTLAYMLVESLSPGSFLLAGDPDLAVWKHLYYFSYVTLTTLGYGDISPVSMMARSMASLEAIVGRGNSLGSRKKSAP